MKNVKWPKRKWYFHLFMILFLLINVIFNVLMEIPLLFDISSANSEPLFKYSISQRYFFLILLSLVIYTPFRKLFVGLKVLLFSFCLLYYCNTQYSLVDQGVRCALTTHFSIFELQRMQIDPAGPSLQFKVHQSSIVLYNNHSDSFIEIANSLVIFRGLPFLRIDPEKILPQVW